MGKNSPPKAIELENVEAAKRIVEEGYGITIIPETAVRREIEAGQLNRVNLEGFDLSIDLNLIFVKGKVLSKAAVTFLKILYGSRLLSDSKNLVDLIKSTGQAEGL